MILLKVIPLVIRINTLTEKDSKANSQVFWLFLALLVGCVSFDAKANGDVASDTHLHAVMTVDDVRHLLTRTGFGAEPAEVLRLLGQSRQSGIDEIISGFRLEPSVPMPPWVFEPLPPYHARADMDAETNLHFTRSRDAEFTQLRQWWILNMLEGSSPQTERMVLFWHDLFATNYRDLSNHSLAMARQNISFRKLGMGSWKLLLKSMIRDAALLIYLDAGSNHKKSPNENLARELLELFTLGEGNYEEFTVREAARSLTGHGVSGLHDLTFRLNTGSQDRNEKELFDKAGRFDGDALVDIILAQQAAPRFLAKRFWHSFIADTPPEPDWIEHQAHQFRESGLNIGKLYREVLQSKAFWNTENRGAIIKSPVDIVVGTARTLEYPKTHWKLMPAWQELIGMNLLEPPNVSGWQEGAAFVTAGHLLNRYKVLRQLTGNIERVEHSEVPNMFSENMQSRRDTESYGLTIYHSEGPSYTASTIQLQRAAYVEDGGKYSLDITINNLSTPSKKFQHLSFTLIKKGEDPIMLQLGSFSCWPDCVEDWPHCSSVDRHFNANKSVAFPWASSEDNSWSIKRNSTCQFNTLSLAERQIVSTIWKYLPHFLEQIRHTKRSRKNFANWAPVVDFFYDEYLQSSVLIENTPYAGLAGTILISNLFEPEVVPMRPLEAPTIQLDNLQALVSILSKEELQVHQFLIPEILGLGVLTAPKMSSRRVDHYMADIIENPLFHLK